MRERHEATRLSPSEIVLTSPCYTSEQVADTLGSTMTPRRLVRLRASGSLLGVKVARRGYLYPTFQFDIQARRLNPRVTRVNRIVVGARGAEEALMWWFDRSSGQRPVDLLDDNAPRLEALVAETVP